jgi:hypothetical protein
LPVGECVYKIKSDRRLTTEDAVRAELDFSVRKLGKITISVGSGGSLSYLNTPHSGRTGCAENHLCKEYFEDQADLIAEPNNQDTIIKWQSSDCQDGKKNCSLKVDLTNQNPPSIHLSFSENDDDVSVSCEWLASDLWGGGNNQTFLPIISVSGTYTKVVTYAYRVALISDPVPVGHSDFPLYGLSVRDFQDNLLPQSCEGGYSYREGRQSTLLCEVYPWNEGQAYSFLVTHAAHGFLKYKTDNGAWIWPPYPEANPNNNAFWVAIGYGDPDKPPVIKRAPCPNI